MSHTGNFHLRGIIEGFYGVPWKHAERLDMLRFLARHGYNAYFYAPKDDLFLRGNWQAPHPPEQLARLGELTGEAKQLGIAFYYCLSPGLDMRYSSELDYERLKGKYQRMFETGVRHFGLFFDDIPMQLLHEEDRQAFAQLADAHAEVTLRLWADLQAWSKESHLVICPTLYNGMGNEPYIVQLTSRLPQEIAVFWTGRFVCSPFLTEGDAQRFYQWTGHRPLYWDNYPVNDLAMATELHIGPLLHRDPELYRYANGYVANVMELVESSKISLLTTSAYLLDPEGYEPEEAWRRAVVEVTGKADAEPFLRFADNVRSSFLNDQESPRLMEALLSFRFHFLHGNQRAAVASLKTVFQEMEETADHLLLRLGNRKLAGEVYWWVEKYRYWAKVGQSAAALIENGLRGRTAQAAFHLFQLKRWMKRAEQLPQKVCGHVMNLFVHVVLEEVTKRA